MATKVGLKLGIDGEAQYKAELNNIIQQAKTLDAEMKAVTSTFTKETTAEEKSAKTSAVLSKQIDTQREKLAKQNEMLEKAVQKYGEADTRTLSWREAVNNTTATLNKMENELRGVNTEVDKTGDELKQGSEAGLNFGDVLKANVAGQAIIKGVEALASAIKQVATEIINAAKESMQWADDLNTLSIQTGLSTDTLQEFEYMAGLLDVDVNTITGSLTKLIRNMNSAKDGSGAAADAFAALGISVTNADGTLRDNYEVFLEAIDALGQMENETERDATAMAIFGKSAQELNTLIAAGSSGLNEYAQEARAAGVIMSEDMVQELVAAQDASDRLSAQMTALKNNIVANIAPGIADAINGVLSLIRGDTTLDEFLGDVTEKAQDIAAKMPEVIENVVTGIVDNLPQIVEAGINILTSLLTGIIQAIPTLLAKLPEIVFNIAKGLLNALPAIFEVGEQLLLNLILGIINYFAVMQQKLDEIGHNIVSGIWDGLKNAAEWFKQKIKEWVGNVMDFLKRLFGIGSSAGSTAGAAASTSAATSASINSAYNAGLGSSINSYGGVTFNITQQPGEDSLALANRINRQLGRIYATV